MRIAIILSRCHRFGSSRYVIEVTGYFSKKGNTTHIFANSCDPLSTPRIIFHKVPTLTHKFLIREGIMNFVHTVNMKRYNNLFDITLAQPTRYFSPMVGEMQFVYREWTRYLVKNGLHVSLGSKITPLIERYNIKKAKKLVAISSSVKNEIIKNYGTPEEKINVVYSGVNLDEFSPENKEKYSKEIRAKHGIPTDDLLLLFVGNPFGRKGLEYLLKALSTLKYSNVKLLVSGKDDPIPYKSLIQKLGLEDKVVFNIGLTPEIFKYYAAADIFVFPTLYEPFGLVILEAMASGLPVVTSEIAGSAELITDGKDGFKLKEPKNPSEIAEKLKYLIENDRMRRSMGKKARRTAERYSWDETAKGMLKTFEEAIKR